MLQKLLKRWDSYRYRLVPWLAFNLKDRSVRYVPKGSPDKLLSDDKAAKILVNLFTEFERGMEDMHFGTRHISKLKERNTHGSNSSFSQKSREQNNFFTNNSSKSDHFIHNSNSKSNMTLKSEFHTNSSEKANKVSMEYSPDPHYEITEMNLEIMYECLGFNIKKTKSTIENAGFGVQVAKGNVPKGSLVSMYPGTIYQHYEPLFFQSLGNPFIFRCLDGIHIDGNDQFISRYIYRSCSYRDRLGPYLMSDMSWLEENPINPLAVGQFVNNHNKEYDANVAYQEFDFPLDFPANLRKYIPNIYYDPGIDRDVQRLTRAVVLVSTRDIEEGEELFSSYFTLVN